MRDITISVDEETYRQASILAAERGVTVSDLLGEYLTGLCLQSNGSGAAKVKGHSKESTRRNRKLDKLLADFDARGIGLDMSENLTREELYEEVMRERGLLR